MNCVYDSEKNFALYGDSLGWEAGVDLKKKVKEIVDVFYQQKSEECNFQNLHNVNHTNRNGNHFVEFLVRVILSKPAITFVELYP